MVAAELVDVRTRLGLSVGSVATQFNVTPAVVEAWESGSLSIPARVGEALAYRAATHERAEALRQSGLPECAVITDLRAKLQARGAGATVADVRAITAHSATCAVCQGREKYIADRFPPLVPPPAQGLQGAIQAVIIRVQRLPAWSRPMAYGGIIVGVFAGLRGALMMLVHGPSWRGLAVIGLAILAGMYLGAVGGATYTLVRPWSRRFGRPGDYLTGLACVYAYVLAIAIPEALFDHSASFRDPAAWIIVVILSTGFGLLIGRSWFRSP
jgi:hypothetical protein